MTAFFGCSITVILRVYRIVGVFRAFSEKGCKNVVNRWDREPRLDALRHEDIDLPKNSGLLFGGEIRFPEQLTVLVCIERWARQRGSGIVASGVTSAAASKGL